MHFKADLFNAVLLCKFRRFFPVRHKNLFPLVLQNFKEILRPRAGNPVRALRLGTIPGAAGKAYDPVDAQLFRKQNGIDKFLMEFPGNFPVRMDRVSVTAQRAELQPVPVHGLLEFLQFAVVF